MLALPSIILGVTILLFAGMVLLVSKEQSKGRRVVLVTVRGWLDTGADTVVRLVKKLCSTIGISLLYVVHQIRHSIAKAIAPRPRTKKRKDKLKFEKTGNHLSTMHDHKADTALSEAQKKKLRNQKLEERF